MAGCGVEALSERLSGGSLSLEDWRDHTTYEPPLDAAQPLVASFWAALEAMDVEERLALWSFVSGAAGVPAGGFGALTNASGEEQRFVLGLTETAAHMPVAHTCGYQLNIPAVAGEADAQRASLLERLRTAIAAGPDFGLG